VIPQLGQVQQRTIDTGKPPTQPALAIDCQKNRTLLVAEKLWHPQRQRNHEFATFKRK
jgi:hypothetical protein